MTFTSQPDISAAGDQGFADINMTSSTLSGS